MRRGNGRRTSSETEESATFLSGLSLRAAMFIESATGPRCPFSFDFVNAEKNFAFPVIRENEKEFSLDVQRPG